MGSIHDKSMYSTRACFLTAGRTAYEGAPRCWLLSLPSLRHTRISTHRLIYYLNYCRIRQVVYRLKLSFEAVVRRTAFSESNRARLPGTCNMGQPVNSHGPLYHLRQLVPNDEGIQFFAPLVDPLSARSTGLGLLELTLAIKAESLVTYHCLFNRSFGSFIIHTSQ